MELSSSTVGDTVAALLARIKHRVAAPPGGKPTIPGVRLHPPPATAAEIARAEARLGFKLPPLFVTLYREIANGGFGPPHGFLGVPSRNAPASLDLVKAYRARDRAVQQWPARLLPVLHAGCDVHFCIDCSHIAHRVIVFDGDLGHLEESDVSEPRSLWPYPEHPLAVCFRTRADCFEGFLEMWLADETQLFRWV
jgi:hypothetical protein